MTEDCPPPTALQQFALGLLPDAEAWPIEAHLASCAQCAADIEPSFLNDALVATFRTRAVVACVDDPAVVTLAAHLRTFVPPTPPALPTTPTDLGAQRTLGRYTLEAIVGHGGMAVVYRAHDPQLKRTVALKVLLDHHYADPVDQARFQREAETLAGLQHPAIVAIHEVGTYAGRPYLALEYVEGGTLAERLQGQPQPSSTSVSLMLRLTEAMHYAHSQGVIHRDLKPSNILLASSWESAKISDFGLARQLDETGLTETGAILGTPGYLAPEQMIGQATVSPAVDVYSLGALFYELLTGRPPFRGANILETLEQARTTDPVPPRRLRASIPRDLETIILKCLRREPRKRYAHAADLHADLERFQRGQPIHARHASYAERFSKWVRRNPMAMTLILVFLCAVITLAVAQQRTQRALDQAQANETKASHASERATTNYRIARDTLQKMLRRTTAARHNDVPGLRALSRQQQEDALAFYLAVAEQAGDDVSIKHEVAQARYQAATLQGDFGHIGEARQNFREAQRLYNELLTHDPSQRAYRRGYVEAFLAAVMYHDIPEEQPNLLADVATLAEDLVRDDPEDAQGHGILANTRNNQGFIAYKYDKVAAERFIRAAVATHEKRLTLVPDDRAAKLAAASALANLHLLAHQQGQPDVHALGERADELLWQAHQAEPTDLFTLARLGDHRTNGAYSLFNAGKGEIALQRLTAVIDRLEAAHKKEPNFLMLTNALLTTNGARAEVSAALKRYDLAIPSWRRVVALAPEDQRIRRHADLIQCLLTAKQPDKAATEADLLAQYLGENPSVYATTTIIIAAAAVQPMKAFQWCQQAKERRTTWPAVRKQLLVEPALATLREHPDWQGLFADE